MNVIDLVADASYSHFALINDLKHSLQDSGGCDHSVGICWCKQIQMLEHAESVQKRMVAYLNKPGIIRLCKMRAQESLKKGPH